MANDSQPQQSALSELRTSEDWWAIWLGIIILAVAFLTTYFAYQSAGATSDEAAAATSVSNPLKPWIAKPGWWESNPADSLVKNEKSLLPGIATTGLMLMALFSIALPIMGNPVRRF